jgi:hypothetical protein
MMCSLSSKGQELGDSVTMIGIYLYFGMIDSCTAVAT